jgi:hypothetical protein
MLAGALAFALLPATATAAPPVRSYAPATLTETTSTPHFVVHFTSAAGADQVDPASVAKLAASAENAYKLEVDTWGFPPPQSDGDAKTDVYIHHITYASAQFAGEPLGLARPDFRGDQTSAALEVQPFATELPDVIAHEFFHVIQYGIFAHERPWFAESSATWAGNNAAKVGKFLRAFTAPGTSLDCVGSAVADCGGDARGYSRWPFWESLFERYGPAFVLEAYRREAVLGGADHASHAIQAITDTLATRSVTLGQAFTDYTADLLAGLRFGPLAALSPTAAATVATGTATAALPAQAVTVNHLANSFVKFAAPVGTSTCHNATLHVAVDEPAGLGSQPVFRNLKDGNQAVVRLALSGATATADIPWSTCSDAIGKLGIPNASTTADAQQFTVTSRMTVGAASRPNTAPPDLGEAPAGPHPAPTILDFRSPRTFTLKRKGRNIIRFSVTVDRAGFAALTVFKRFRTTSRGLDSILDVADDPTQPDADVRLRKGLNHLSLRITGRHKLGRFLLVVLPYSGDTIDDDFEDGFAASKAIHFKR